MASSFWGHVTQAFTDHLGGGSQDPWRMGISQPKPTHLSHCYWHQDFPNNKWHIILADQFTPQKWVKDSLIPMSWWKRPRKITHPRSPGTFSLSHCWWCCPAMANLQIGGHAHGRGAPHDPPCLVAPHRRKPPRQHPRVGNVSRPPAVAHGPKIWRRNTTLRISWAEKVRMARIIPSSPTVRTKKTSGE